jgi:hypothetical protein
MKDFLRIMEWIIGIAFFIAAIVFYNVGEDMWTRTAIHEVTELLHYVCSVLCAGFGALMIKGK